MYNLFLGMLFLYFPEDKTEYIPAAISFSIFLAACVIVFFQVKKYSRKEEQKAKELEDRLKLMNDEKQNKSGLSDSVLEEN